MRSAALILVFFLILSGYVLFHQEAWNCRDQIRRATEAGYVFPSRFSRILAMGNKGLLADFMFLKTITFFGERAGAGQDLASEDWDYVVAALGAVTDLDPYFLDPYVFAEGALAWDAGRFDEANALLEKGFRHRTAEWRLPYYIGFNYFYFLRDYGKGAEYVMQAARTPGSPSFLATLGARLAYYGEKSQTAVLFLKGMLADTQDARLKTMLEARLLALERAALLEELLVRYRQERGHEASSFNDLVAAGYVDRLPEEPYGGQWVVLKSGRVFSTSKFVFCQTPAGKEAEH